VWVEEGSDFAGHLEHGEHLIIVSVMFCLQRPTYSIEFPYMGVSRDTQLHI